MKFCGIDLHSNNSVVVVTDETDRVLVSRRCPNELTPILSLLEPHRAELVGVVVESTYNWYWLVDGLKAAGFEVKLAHPVAMKRYDGLKHQTTRMMRLSWRIRCDSGFYRPDTSTRRKNVRCEIWHENVFNWYAVGLSTFWRSRTSPHASSAMVSAVMKSKAFAPHLLTGWACQQMWLWR
ncbi:MULTISPECIES: IS110 family transposase [unclassified Pseudomonas]|uniref:IS110 family transposase n=1 Tax=unclassified Pseudomonas TaxID=196821 RepID=UPI001EEFB440|nr:MULTISPECIES: IS110 family transposase [unclassified Pseudomonas]